MWGACPHAARAPLSIARRSASARRPGADDLAGLDAAERRAASGTAVLRLTAARRKMLEVNKEGSDTRCSSMRWKRLWGGTENQGYSTPIRARNSQAPPSPASSKRPNRDFDGRAGTFHGQHLHRTFVALDQVRGGATGGPCRRPRARAGIGFWMTFYNSRRAHGDEQSDADRRPARRH